MRMMMMMMMNWISPIDCGEGAVSFVPKTVCSISLGSILGARHCNVDCPPACLSVSCAPLLAGRLPVCATVGQMLTNERTNKHHGGDDFIRINWLEIVNANDQRDWCTYLWLVTCIVLSNHRLAPLARLPWPWIICSTRLTSLRCRPSPSESETQSCELANIDFGVLLSRQSTKIQRSIASRFSWFVLSMHSGHHRTYSISSWWCCMQLYVHN